MISFLDFRKIVHGVRGEFLIDLFQLFQGFLKELQLFFHILVNLHLFLQIAGQVIHLHFEVLDLLIFFIDLIHQGLAFPHFTFHAFYLLFKTLSGFVWNVVVQKLSDLFHCCNVSLNGLFLFDNLVEMLYYLLFFFKRPFMLGLLSLFVITYVSFNDFGIVMTSLH